MTTKVVIIFEAAEPERLERLIGKLRWAASHHREHGSVLRPLETRQTVADLEAVALAVENGLRRSLAGR